MSAQLRCVKPGSNREKPRRAAAVTLTVVKYRNPLPLNWRPVERLNDLPAVPGWDPANLLFR